MDADTSEKKRRGPKVRFPGYVRLPCVPSLPPSVAEAIEQEADRTKTSRARVVAMILEEWFALKLFAGVEESDPGSANRR
jgi:hypothetical protein